jgi:transposase
LCLDEIAPHKGQGNYYLIISAPELGIVLDVLKDRQKASLEAWFEERGAAWCAAVEVCCADMWDAYHQAAGAKLPNARQIVDRFHVVSNLNEAITKTRRAIQGQADETTREILKGCRWLLLKNPEKLKDTEQQRLQAMLESSPELKTCYELKQAFRNWFNHSANRQQAEAGLSDWMAKVEATTLKALHGFCKTLSNWRERILNYFDGRHSNGFAEGVNLKIKMINRRGFGYRNFANFRLHVLVAFDPLPH